MLASLRDMRSRDEGVFPGVGAPPPPLSWDGLDPPPPIPMALPLIAAAAFKGRIGVPPSGVERDEGTPRLVWFPLVASVSVLAMSGNLPPVLTPASGVLNGVSPG